MKSFNRCVQHIILTLLPGLEANSSMPPHLTTPLAAAGRSSSMCGYVSFPFFLRVMVVGDLRADGAA